MPIPPHPWLEPLRPHRCVRGVGDITCTELQAAGIQAVLLDLDNTLTPWKSLEIAPPVITWVAELQAAGVAACIVSNAATARRVRPIGDLLGIPWITRAGKPFPHAFHRAMTLLQADPAATAIIGDQVFTDILGGNLLGLHTILVDPLSAHESVFTRLLQRPLERWIGREPKVPGGGGPSPHGALPSGEGPPPPER
jgi:HAD superfamily phosphatase (TIGR01668 family)